MTDWFWLIPFAPGLSALVLVLLGRRLSRRYISLQACGAVFISLFIAAISFIGLLGSPSAGPALVKTLFTWIQAGRFSADLSFQFDPLAAVMALVVTGVGFLIHVYSVGYMAGDKS